MGMRCPVCGQALLQKESHGVVVDYCAPCGSIWFDKGELADFTHHILSRSDIKPQKIKLYHRREVKTRYDIDETVRKCPKCDLGMKKINYAYDSNVFVDRCENCGGIWANAKEIRQIASYLKYDPDSAAAARVLLDATAVYDPQAELDRSLGWLVFVPHIICIPVGDDIECRRRPIVTIGLIAICCALFSLFAFTDSMQAIPALGFVPANFFSIGLLTSIFMHAGIIHLAGNMLFLWLFGDNVEDTFSHVGYFFVFLWCGLFANIVHGLFNLGAEVPVVGASGAISGIMGAYLIYYPYAKVRLLMFWRTFELPVLIYLGGWFIFQLVAVIQENQGAPSAHIAWYAHIAGFLMGAFIAFAKKTKLQFD